MQNATAGRGVDPPFLRYRRIVGLVVGDGVGPVAEGGAIQLRGNYRPPEKATTIEGVT